MSWKARTDTPRADIFGWPMESEKQALKNHIARQTGASFIDSPFGWKTKCPLEDGSTSQSFFVLDSPHGEFYCLDCKAEGSFAEFNLLWNRIQAARRPPDASKQPERTAQGETQAPPAVFEQILTKRPGESSTSEASAHQIQSPRFTVEPKPADKSEEGLSRQLEYLQRQNEGLHGLVLKYNDLLSTKKIDTEKRDQGPGSRWVPIDVYNDLLDRYERLLIFAGEMQEKERRQKYIQDKDYAELLARYERVLMFAGELQERCRQQLLPKGKDGELAEQVDELKRRASAADNYIELLEKALNALRRAQAR